MKHTNKLLLTFLILIISVPGLAQPPTCDPSAPPQMGIDSGEHKTYFESNYFSALDTRLCASERRYFVASNEMNEVAALTHSPPSLPTPSTLPTDLSVLDVDRLHYCQGEELKVGPDVPDGKIEYLNGFDGRTSNPLFEWHAKALIPSTTPILVLDRAADFYHDYVETSADQYNSRVDKSSTNFEYNNLICDFIYRLSPEDAALSGNLYEIDYTVYRGANTTTGSVTISNSDYDPANAIPDNANWTSGPHLGDKNERQSNIINFPSIRPKRYAIRRIVIPITNGTGGYPTRITYSLKCINPSADIFVRGFRLRSELMNELENGYLGCRSGTHVYKYVAADGEDTLNYSDPVELMRVGGE